MGEKSVEMPVSKHASKALLPHSLSELTNIWYTKHLAAIFSPMVRKKCIIFIFLTQIEVICPQQNLCFHYSFIFISILF